MVRKRLTVQQRTDAGYLTARKRFYAKVQKTDTCWLWTGAKNPNGYGEFRPVSSRIISSWPVKAHRWAWQMAYGDIPDGAVVRHRCNHPACVNPQHLVLGTQIDNIADTVAQRRHAHGEKHGAARLSEADVLAIRDILKHRTWRDGAVIAVASKYGVSPRAIRAIAPFRGGAPRRWAHI